MSFPPEKRLVFSFPEFKSGKPVFFDPLEIHRRLMHQTAGRFNELMDAQASDDAVKSSAAEAMIMKAAFAAFEFKPIDPETGEGHTQAYAKEVLQLYLNWIEEKKIFVV